jgi:hypothetical protein
MITIPPVPKPKKPSGKIDTTGFMFPKNPRVKSKATIEKTRKQACEISGHTKGLHQHHVVPKGAGGPDIKENLITLDAENHTKAHNGQISRDALWEIVARREGKTVEEIRRIVAQAMGREFV